MPRKGQLEADIESAFVVEVESLGGLAEKVVHKDVRGWPDRSCYLDGIHWLVEFKRPGAGPSHHQMKWIIKLRAIGIRVGVAYSVADAWRIGGFLTLANEAKK